jgi:hypothetical protein
MTPYPQSSFCDVIIGGLVVEAAAKLAAQGEPASEEEFHEFAAVWVETATRRAFGDWFGGAVEALTEGFATYNKVRQTRQRGLS